MESSPVGETQEKLSQREGRRKGTVVVVVIIRINSCNHLAVPILGTETEHTLGRILQGCEGTDQMCRPRERHSSSSSSFALYQFENYRTAH